MDVLVRVSPALLITSTPSLVFEIPRYAIGTFSGKGCEFTIRRTILPVIIVIAISRITPIILELADSRSHLSMLTDCLDCWIDCIE
jgi:hypothetical protein